MGKTVDSLFRRGDVIFRTNPNFAVTQWCNYNQAVLDFWASYPEQCLLLDINSVIQSPDRIIEIINQKFELELRSPESLYQESLFYQRSQLSSPSFNCQVFSSSFKIYTNKLQQQADILA